MRVVIDFPDSQSEGRYLVLNRTVVVVAIYNASGSYSWVDGCLNDVQAARTGATSE